jgi:hypothetical protein
MLNGTGSDGGRPSWGPPPPEFSVVWRLGKFRVAEIMISARRCAFRLRRQRLSALRLWRRSRFPREAC